MTSSSSFFSIFPPRARGLSRSIRSIGAKFDELMSERGEETDDGWMGAGGEGKASRAKQVCFGTNPRPIQPLMLDDWTVSESQPCVHSFNASESGQCGMVGWWIGVWRFHLLPPPSRRSSSRRQQRKEGRKEEDERNGRKEVERRKGSIAARCPSTLTRALLLSSLLPSVRCPFHSQRRRGGGIVPFHRVHISHTPSVAITIS